MTTRYYSVSLAAVVGSLLTLGGCVSTGGGTTASAVDVSKAPAIAVGSDAITQRLNAVRAQYGAPPISRSPKADQAAQRHAQDMYANNFYDHHGSDGSTHTKRLRRSGCKGGAENIAEGTWRDPNTVVEGWLSSPKHRQNILYPAVRNYGLAKSGTKWVMTLSAGC
ncbi:CAP domain-containing protein [Palleronia caenipelagi]|nr:CAP domain-containing protein [Palleronia caenipelagi]